MKIDSQSRSRIGIEWYDDEDEANRRGEEAKKEPGVDAANLGIAQVGRDPGLDRRDEDGVVYAFAVVVP